MTFSGTRDPDHPAVRELASGWPTSHDPPRRRRSLQQRARPAGRHLRWHWPVERPAALTAMQGCQGAQDEPNPQPPTPSQTWWTTSAGSHRRDQPRAPRAVPRPACAVRTRPL